MNVDSADDKRTVSALAKLLRDELREARFFVTRLERTDAEIHPDQSTSVALESKSEREFDAVGLKDFHDAGAWKRTYFRFETKVQLRLCDFGSDDRRTRFDRLLDDLGVLLDGHVAHVLASLLHGYIHTTLAPDSPGASVGFAKAANLWHYLLLDACLETPRRTATKVLRWTRGARLGFETRVLLGRLHAADSFTLANGLAVERLPSASKDLEYWFPVGIGIAPSEYLGRTMLRIPCTIGPVLSKPGRVTEQRRGVPTQRWKPPPDVASAWPLPRGRIDELTLALSLVCNVAVETPIVWTDYGDHTHFAQRHGMLTTGTGEPIPRRAAESPLTAADLKEALRLQPALCRPPTDVQTALRYWLKSKARRVDVADGLVFLRTALEALFLDGGDSGELAFRLATHGAWYTGRNRVERRDRFDLINKVYGAASGAVHRGRVKGAASDLLKEGQAICRQAILKRLRSTKAPVWPDIVFGR